MLTMIITISGMMTEVRALSYNATIPIKQKIQVESGRNSTFTYELTSNGMPMPEGSKMGRYEFTITGTNQKDIKITYGHAGEYEYTVRQTVKEEQERYTYDRSEYTVIVRVLNTADGLKGQIYSSKNGSGKTNSGIEFVNGYTPMSKEPPKAESKKNGAIDVLSSVTKKIQTGDKTNITKWIMATVGAFIAFAVMARKKKEEEKDEKQQKNH